MNRSSSTVICGRMRAHRTDVRKGAATVEMAFILPIFLTFIFVLIQYGYCMWVQNLVRNATREAARYGTTDGVTTEMVRQTVASMLEGIVPQDSFTVSVRDASTFENGDIGEIGAAEFAQLPSIELGDAPPRQLFIVRTEVALEDVMLVPLAGFEEAYLYGQTIMRHE